MLIVLFKYIFYAYFLGTYELFLERKYHPYVVFLAYFLFIEMGSQKNFKQSHNLGKEDQYIFAILKYLVHNSLILILQINIEFKITCKTDFSEVIYK